MGGHRLSLLTNSVRTLYAAAARMDARDLGAAKWSGHTSKAASLAPPPPSHASLCNSSTARRRLILYGSSEQGAYPLQHSAGGGSTVGYSYGNSAQGPRGGDSGGGAVGCSGARRVLTVAQQQARRPKAIIYQECVYPVTAGDRA